MQAFLALVVICSLFLSSISEVVTVGAENGAVTTEAAAPLANITFYIEQKVHDRFVHRTRIQLIPKPDGKNGLLYLDKNTIHGDDVKYFKTLVQQQALYTIRIRSEKEDFKGSFVITSIPVV
jgi:hypothetical protein